MVQTMETIKQSILINADIKKVWHTMLDDKTYRVWTAEFGPGSYYEGSWDKGSEMRFLAPDEEGKHRGMFSRIKENIPYQFVSIEHLGLIADGKVDTTSDEVKKWAHAFENYTFRAKDGKTEVVMEMQLTPEYKKMMEEMWGRALKVLKDLCER